MSREVHVAFCEELRVRVPRLTLLVVLVDGFRKWRWLVKAVMPRLGQEFQKLGVELNTEKTKVVDLSAGGVFSFLGFYFRRAITRNGKVDVLFMPTMKARKSLSQKLKAVFRRFKSQPISRVIDIINPILRGWVHYFRVGMSSQCFLFWLRKGLRRKEDSASFDEGPRLPRLRLGRME